MQLNTSSSISSVLNNAHITLIGSLWDTSGFSNDANISSRARLGLHLRRHVGSWRFAYSRARSAVDARAAASRAHRSCSRAHASSAHWGRATARWMHRRGQYSRWHETRLNHLSALLCARLKALTRRSHKISAVLDVRFRVDECVVSE